ncbi:MAG TPA: radical SAM family heme chaperone HemW [Bryobacteraceae bacterium]|nr:radical SAM family heme chaperone HemW [Bryobacteraceae bacterium]
MSGVYISFPFCAQKCSFCNFASGVFPREMETEYCAALHREIAGHVWKWRPDTVYLGGGTPSQMDVSALAGLLSRIPGRPWREAAIEALPGSFSSESVRAWREAGINRVSIGVQSFVPREIAHTGRRHDAEQIAADCALLRGAGIENINLDLIAGLPCQTADTWNDSLDWIKRIAPPHVSVYLFEIDEDSRLGLEILQGGSRYDAAAVPPDDIMADLYQSAVERLQKMGIIRYEISNFAQPGYESQHNLKYWKLEPYAGFGADAHSFDGVTRSGNVETAHEYLERDRMRRSVRNNAEDAKLEEERFFVGLRLMQGIEPREEEWRRFAEPIHRFLTTGLLEREGSRLRLSSQGVLLSNEVFQEFVNL